MNMLRKLNVSNFKCFKEETVFDLSSAQNYTFNPECVKNGIVNNAIIYGYNGVGKSNLGWAIFDIVEHLTDNTRIEFPYENYTNAFNDSQIACFEYEFLIGGDIVNYSYTKSDYRSLVTEHFSINGDDIISFDRRNGNNTFTCTLQGTESLNKNINDNELSVLKYVKNNSVLDGTGDNKIFKDFFNFVEHMLFFRSLKGNVYIGKAPYGKSPEKAIIEQNRVSDFEQFLNDANVKCRLAVVEDKGEQKIAFDFGNRKVLFNQIASTGTLNLTLFYGWFLHILLLNEVSFLFIDEFDAFYHNELSRMIINKLKESGVQFVVTTHNTSIMSNDLMRPDCYYLMNGSHILPLSKCTGKELREAHNIEKIYRAGAFYVE